MDCHLGAECKEEYVIFHTYVCVLNKSQYKLAGATNTFPLGMGMGGLSGMNPMSMAGMNPLAAYGSPYG